MNTANGIESLSERWKNYKKRRKVKALKVTNKRCVFSKKGRKNVCDEKEGRGSQHFYPAPISGESSSSFSNTQPRSHSLKRAVSALPKSPRKKHCLKSVRTRSYSGQYFSTSGLNTERYFVSLRIRPNVEKYRPE